MPFSEALKLKVRKKAAFRCCRCHEVGVDIHHIVPAAKGGPNTMENAAPLCQNCHDRFGDNPRKRKEIAQMRDWWYEVAAEKWPTPESKVDDAELNQLILDIQGGELSKRDKLIRKLEKQVSDLDKALNRSEGKTTASQAQRASRVATGIATATQLGAGTWANVQCRKCRSFTGILVGAEDGRCPGCGTPFEVT